MFNNIWIWVLIVIGIIFCILMVKYSPKLIGFLGENNTKDALKGLPKDKYKIINNILIKINGYTHQIDHVIVSQYGIFCIETKQYNGYIKGSKWDKNWTRIVGKNRYLYENPIRQNYGHVKTLCELLNMDESKIYNIVCIPSGAKLRIKHDGELVRYNTIVDKILSYKDIVIDNVDEIVDIINKNNITDKTIKKEHIENIRNNLNNG